MFRTYKPPEDSGDLSARSTFPLSLLLSGERFLYEPPGWVPEARDFMLAEPIRVDKGGMIRVPEDPGLGVELDMDRIRAME